MTTITVYDPPMCCSSGVCGADVDQRLVEFAANLDWLKAKGVAVRRIGLSQEPMEFIARPAIKALMEASGGDDLPAVLVGEEIVSQARYPSRAELAGIAGIGERDVAIPVLNRAPAARPSSCCGGSAKTVQGAGEVSDNGCCGKAGSALTLEPVASSAPAGSGACC